jgi:hypothetical protein
MADVVMLPCPFCGSTNIDPEGWVSTERKGPACDDCAACADTVEIWNTRASLSQAGAGGGVDALREAAEEFCRRVEAGEVRSKRSYAAFKAALAALAASPSAGERRPMNMLVDNDWLREKIENGPDDGECLAGSPAPPVPTASVEAVACRKMADRLMSLAQSIWPGTKQQTLLVDASKLLREIASLTPAPTQGDGVKHTTLEFLDGETVTARVLYERKSTPSAPVSAPSPAGGVREAFETCAKMVEERLGVSLAKPLANAIRARGRQEEVLSPPATPEPVSAPAGGDAVEQAAIRIIRNRAADGPAADRAVAHARQFDTHVWRDAKRDARAALSNAPSQEVVPVAPAVREDIKAARTMLAGGDPLGAWQILDSLIAAHPAGEKEGRS